MTPIRTKRSAATGLLAAAVAMTGALAAPAARAAVPGITGTAFSLVASEGFTSQPDGAQIYTWGYGCAAGFVPGYAPFPGTCLSMQLPGPTLIVTEGSTISVTLSNNLPRAAGNTSIVFPGFTVTTTGGVPGLLTQEAANAGGACTSATPGCSVTYAFTATQPGTYAYYSGTQADLQVEMGLFGAIVVLPNTIPAGCRAVAGVAKGDYRLAPSAYDHPGTCYDREYLFQFSELDSRTHDLALAQVLACKAANTPTCPEVNAVLAPYHANYFLVNGRSMPDDMDGTYAAGYPHQPYNGNPHMHPGELMLMRIVGQGHMQHPFHFHANHARVIARDGNMLLSTVAPPPGAARALAGPLLYTTPTVSGQTQDQIFTWTGKNLNWDVYNHHAGDGSVCVADANGFYTSASVPPAPANAPNYGEWCADHDKPIPVTPPDPTIVAIGQWYGGTPYLGIQSTGSFTSTNEPPGTLNQNPEAGYAYMWHSHNEREITTNDVFPGGMMMMLLIDPPVWPIDETL